MPESTYFMIHDSNPHEVARHMMVVAGTTFNYELIESGEANG